jgi:RNA-directed DNA polymerase
MLTMCHYELSGNKATGVDKVTKKEYETNLEENIDDLIIRRN